MELKNGSGCKAMKAMKEPMRSLNSWNAVPVLNGNSCEGHAGTDTYPGLCDAGYQEDVQQLEWSQWQGQIRRLRRKVLAL